MTQTQQTEQQTPVTDMVRDQQDDYLAAVQSLEESHTELLEACQYIDSCAETAVPVGEGYVQFRMTVEGLRQLRDAIAKATT